MTLKVGIVGCGKIAGNHARALQQVPGVEVIGCCDPDLGRAQEFAALHGIPAAVSSVEQLLALGLDACTVCTPIRYTKRWSLRLPRLVYMCCARNPSQSMLLPPTA